MPDSNTPGAHPGEQTARPHLIRSPDELTPAWLTAALRFAGVIDRAEVSALAVEPLDKGRTGRLARVRPRYSEPAHGAPASLVMKLPGPPGPVRDLVLRFGLYEREVQFYRSLAPRTAIPTPGAIYADAGASGETVLLLEDVADAAEGDLARGASPEQVAVAIHHLAAMHAAWWDSSALDEFAWLPARNNPQTVALSATLPANAWAAFVKRNASWLSPAARTLIERLEGDRTVLDRLSTPPLTLVHGDTRINNMLFTGGPALRAVVDWQSVMRARPGVDLACLLINSLPTPERRATEADLLRAYHGALVAAGVEGYSLGDLWTDYRLEVLNELNQVVVWSALGLGAGGGAAPAVRLFAAIDDLALADLLPAAGRRPSRRRALLRRVGLG